MSRKTFVGALLVVMTVMMSHVAWAGSKLKLENEGEKQVTVTFITINPNSTNLNKPEEVKVDGKSTKSYILNDPCIYEIRVNGVLKMTPKEKTGLGLGCFNVGSFDYGLTINANGDAMLK